MNEVNCTSISPPNKSGAMRSAYCPLRLPPEVMVGTVLVPPPIRRGEGARSGAPSGMMAQPQPAQGCAVCGGPSDLAPDPRETAQRSDWRGKRPLVTLGLSKVTRPSPKGGRNPFEASGLASCTARPCHTQRLLPPTPCLGTDDYAYRLIDPTIARRSRACLPQARSLAERPGCHR